MEILDLHTFPPGHPPSPWPLPVQGRWQGDTRYAVLAPGLTLRAVGWLGAEARTRGVTPAECIDRLVGALESDKVIREGMQGYHDCEVCEAQGLRFEGTDEFYRLKFRGSLGKNPVVQWRKIEYFVPGYGHHLIQHGAVVYVCPQLIVHYILHHEYRPPEEFVHAVVQGRFLTFDDLQILPKGGEREWIDRLRCKTPARSARFRS